MRLSSFLPKPILKLIGANVHHCLIVAELARLAWKRSHETKSFPYVLPKKTSITTYHNSQVSINISLEILPKTTLFFFI